MWVGSDNDSTEKCIYCYFIVHIKSPEFPPSVGVQLRFLIIDGL